MPRARLAFAAGIVLVVVSWVLPCLAFLNLPVVAMPHQELHQNY